MCGLSPACVGWLPRVRGGPVADGPDVSFVPVTYYLGPWQYLLRRHRIWASAGCRRAVGRGHSSRGLTGRRLLGAADPTVGADPTEWRLLATLTMSSHPVS